MEPFDLRLRPLASQLGIAFNADGLPLPVFNRSNHDLVVMSDACIIENLLHFDSAVA